MAEEQGQAPASEAGAPQITTNAAPGGTGSAEISAEQMVGDQMAAQAQQPNQVPAWLMAMPADMQADPNLRRFDTQEKFVESYRALQTKLTSTPAAAPAAPDTSQVAPAQPSPSPGATPPGDGLNISPGSATGDPSFLKRAGLEESDLIKTFQETGALSPEQRTKLRGTGLADTDIDMMVRGRVAENQIQATQAQAAVAGAQQIAGGETQLQQVLDWARENIPEDQKGQINNMLGNPASSAMAVELLVNKFRTASGVAGEKTPISGSNVPPSAGVLPFKSIQESSAAMMDSRMGKDAAFTAEVKARLRVTPPENQR